MRPASVTRGEQLRVVGIAARTTNADEMQSSNARIPGLWGQFTSDNWAERLGRGGAVGPILAVYSAYETDVSGRYQILIGREHAESFSATPPLQAVDIPPGQYLVFTCSGALPGAIIDGWRAVWAFFDRPSAPRRAYTADFEAYREPERTEIWIGVADTPSR